MGYMREYWVIMHGSPILYRYIDWSITVPLQMIEFYLILLAVQPTLGGGMFWRLMIGTVAMLAFGYAGESKVIDPFMGFVLGMMGWVYNLADFVNKIAFCLAIWASAKASTGKAETASVAASKTGGLCLIA